MPPNKHVRHAGGLLTPSQTPIADRVLPSVEEASPDFFLFLFQGRIIRSALPVAAQELENGGHMRDLSGDIPRYVFEVPSGECSLPSQTPLR